MIKKSVLFSLLFLILISFISSSELRVTNEHPFLVDNEWVHASDLKVGDELRTVDGRIARINSIEDIVDNVSVYNINVNYPDNFFANGVLVHNKPMAFSSAVDYAVDPAKRVNEFEDTNVHRVFRRMFGGSSQKYGPDAEEIILIDRAYEPLRVQISDLYRRTFGQIPNPEAPTKMDLEIAASRFYVEASKQLPFLGFENVEQFHRLTRQTFTPEPESLIMPNLKETYWRKYLRQFSGGQPKKLSVLGSTKMLDCTGQHLTIQQSIPNEGWMLYHDIMTNKNGIPIAGKTRTHTFLAKRYGDNIVIIDVAEGAGLLGYTHSAIGKGDGFVRSFDEFSKIYLEAKIDWESK